MSKQNQHKSNIPELRFPEFSGEWVEDIVGNLFEFKNGLNKSKEYFGYGYPIVNFKDVFNKRGITSNDINGKVDVTEKELNNYSVQKGDVFFTRTSETIDEIGYPSVILEDIKNAVFSGFILRARPKNNIKLNSNLFKKYVFFTNTFRKEMITKSSMTTRALTSGTSINKMKFFYPMSFQEQEKIGDFFSKLDRQIELEEKKLALLEEQKKGYMQKIFSQELRFKDDNGIEYPEWEEKRLGEIAKITRGLTYKPSDIRSNGVRVLRSSNIINNKFYMHHDDVFVDDKIVKIPFVNNGDILITAANGSPRLVGKHALINKLSNNSVAGGFMYTLKAENTKFIQTWMYTTEYQRIITKVQGGNGSIGNLSKKDLETGLITVPSTEEQVKIGSFFEKIDGIISKNLQKTQRMQDMKKSLLQQIYL